jgi:hypothetical protein
LMSQTLYFFVTIHRVMSQIAYLFVTHYRWPKPAHAIFLVSNNKFTKSEFLCNFKFDQLKTRTQRINVYGNAKV